MIHLAFRVSGMVVDLLSTWQHSLTIGNTEERATAALLLLTCRLVCSVQQTVFSKQNTTIHTELYSCC